MTDIRATVYVSGGMWVARCPRDGCTNAEHFGAAPATGHVGGLTGGGFHCRPCGLVCDADWPPNVDDITYLLSLRPVPSTRNWEPPETVEDLLKENFAHGCLPASLESAPLLVVDDHIVGLTALPRGERLAIGAG